MEAGASGNHLDHVASHAEEVQNVSIGTAIIHGRIMVAANALDLMLTSFRATLMAVQVDKVFLIALNKGLSAVAGPSAIKGS